MQPHSGSQANAAVYMALVNPGDTIMGMSLADGGHLTHGAKVSFSGKLYHAVQYGLDVATGLIDYDALASLALEHQPKMSVAGFSAYSRHLDFRRADSVGALLFVDIAHVAGLIFTGPYPNPVPYADVVTTTTHKTLRGPRGGVILARANATTRGFGIREATTLAGWICDLLDRTGDPSTIERVRRDAAALCARFPVYGPLTVSGSQRRAVAAA